MTAKVLVVDDIEFNVKLLDTKLKQDYYNVFTAYNGKQAIEKAKEVKPDIILMDIMMPEMDGFEATKRIKNDPEIAHIPIIMVTALNAQEDKVRGLEAGADDFLTKPINEHALMTRLRSLVRIKQMTDELRLRDLTSEQFGVASASIEKRNKVSGSKVLLIEDDMPQAEKIRKKLALQEIAGDIAENTEQMMGFLHANEYKIIIVSTLLIDDDGLRIISIIKNDEKFRMTPILVVVDEHDTMTLDRGLELGAADYIISPVEVNEVLARCITQIRRKNYQDELRENYLSSLTQSVRDGLTNLYNRRYFETHGRNIFNQFASIDQTISIVMMDIDHFKKVNDTYGHQAGDEVIKEFAARIGQNIRLTDLCARYGGEEFVLVLPNTPSFFAQFVAERIRMLIESVPFKIPTEPFEIHCTSSAGIAEKNEGDTFDTLLARADKCLYLAKETGRNQVITDLDENLEGSH